MRFGDYVVPYRFLALIGALVVVVLVAVIALGGGGKSAAPRTTPVTTAPVTTTPAVTTSPTTTGGTPTVTLPTTTPATTPTTPVTTSPVKTTPAKTTPAKTTPVKTTPTTTPVAPPKPAFVTVDVSVRLRTSAGGAATSLPGDSFVDFLPLGGGKIRTGYSLKGGHVRLKLKVGSYHVRVAPPQFYKTSKHYVTAVVFRVRPGQTHATVVVGPKVTS